MQKKFADAADKQRAYRERKRIMLMFVALDEEDQAYIGSIVTRVYKQTIGKVVKRNA